jgi:hypothetical protein
VMGSLGDGWRTDTVLDRSRGDRYRAAMNLHRSAGTPSEAAPDHGPAASRWYGYFFYGYVPPALLVGREAVSR